MFERMETAEQVYEGQTPSKKIPREDANRDNHVRKRKIGEAASPTNSTKGRTGKRKTKNSVSPIKKTTGADKTLLLHIHGHFSEDCRVLEEHSKKYAAQRPHKYSEAQFGI